jgi:8-oxo-dGTP pyrophosphatase MutT (NUDIX family)
MTHVETPLGSYANPIPRRAARVLLLDAAGRVLMFHGFDPARPGWRYWFTVGGGLAEGESPQDGAVRELGEETGLAVAASSLGAPVWHQVMDFPYDGRWYRQEQDFFVVRVTSWEVAVAGFDEEERRSIDGHRWWSPRELDSTDERFYPEELPALLRSILMP